MSTLYPPHPLKHIVGLSSSSLFCHSSDSEKIKWYVPKHAFFPQRSLTSFHCIHRFFHGLTCPSLLRNGRNPICFCYFVCSCLWLFVVVCYCNPLCHLQGILGIMVPPYFLVLTSDNLVVVYQDLQKVWSLTFYKSQKTSKNVVVLNNWRVHDFPKLHF
jgi:hypothetical protein